MDKELVDCVEQAEEMQIASKANILGEQKFKLAYPLYQLMMYKACEKLLDIFKIKHHLSTGQIKLLAAYLEEKVISKVGPTCRHCCGR